MYLLDTNTCIFIKNKKPLRVLEKLRSVIEKNVYLSSITVAELQFGVYNSQNIEKNRISLTEFLV
jgi:tRNA(fMet)-specific endonuclease VapC